MEAAQEVKTGAYIVQANRDAPILLCVRDYERGGYHQFELDIQNVARLAAECSDRVSIALGAVDMKSAGQESAKLLSALWQDRGLPSGS